MKKSTKGALAASAAGVLLLGGAGSLAFWTDQATVAGGSITSGHLKLTTPDCGVGWTIDGGATFDTTAGRIVPGDTLTKVCTFKLDATGNHLKATFNTVAASTTGDAALTSKVTITSAYKLNGTTTTGSNVAVVNGDTVTVTTTVDFPYGTVADNTTNVSTGLTATLGAITTTATQTHSAT